MSSLERFVDGWEKLRRATVATAKDMPEEHYDSAPFDGMWSFRKQVAHILNVGDVFFDGLARGEFDASKFAVDNYGKLPKAEIVAALERRLLEQQESPCGDAGARRQRVAHVGVVVVHEAPARKVDGARPGVVGVPLDPHRPAEPLRREPGLPLPLEVPGDEGLDVRHVREVPDPQ